MNRGRVLWGGAWRFTCFDTAVWDSARVFGGGVWVLLLFSGASTPFFYAGGFLKICGTAAVFCCVSILLSVLTISLSVSHILHVIFTCTRSLAMKFPVGSLWTFTQIIISPSLIITEVS